MSGIGCAVVDVAATGNALIDGVLYGVGWSGPITYAFPDNPADYSYQKEAQASFAAATVGQRAATLFALEQSAGTSADDGFSVEGFTNAELSVGDAETANLRVAQSDVPQTSYTYMPGGIAEAGDMWFGHRYDYTNAQAGNYAWHTILHEIGHSLGLKHGNEAVNGFAALPAEYDSLEYTVMTYRTYPGGPTDGYSYSQWSAPQTYMMADIAALQHMYGADFTTNSDDTVYRWDSTSGDTYVNGKRAIDAGGATIFATIWDGGGTDTYDLSRYSSDLHVNLAPGQASLFDKSQLASFGSHHYASSNIYNALQYDGDPRSLIENAIGGRGDDVFVGNIAGNKLSGSDGDDQIRGQSGADMLLGGDGSDWLAGGEDNDRLYGGEGVDRLLGGNGDDRLFGADGNDRLDGGDGNNVLFGGGGNDKFFCELGVNMLTGGKGRDLFVISGGVDTIADFDGNDVLNLRSFGFSNVKEAMSHAEQVGHDVVFSFGSGSVLTIEGINIHDLNAADFLF